MQNAVYLVMLTGYLRSMRKDQNWLLGFLLKILCGKQYLKPRLENKFGMLFQLTYWEPTKDLMAAGLRSLEALGMKKNRKDKNVV